VCISLATLAVGIPIIIAGIDCWASFKFGVEGDELEAMSIAPKPQSESPLMTLYTQEMLKRGFLAYGTSMPTFAHKEHHIRVFIQAAEEVFGLLAGWLQAAGGDESQLMAKLLGPIAGPPAIPKRLVR
jgi:hypothetical protein